MRAKLSKRICSAILAVMMLMSLAPATAFAITDEDIPASVELGKGFNLLDCKTFEAANLKSAILFNSVETLNPTKVRIAEVESNMTYITSMSSYLDNTHTDISAEAGVTKQGLLVKAEVKAKFGFKGEWESSGTVNTSRLILEILAKAYKYALNMEMSDPWAKNDDGEYISINPTFAYDLVHMRPEDLFNTYGTHIVTQYDAGGEAYTSYEGTDASNSMKSEFDITANAEVKVEAADVADVNVSVNTSGGEKHEDSFANNNKQTSMRVRGGDPFYSTFDKIVSGDADESVNSWLQSMFTMDENTGSTKATIIQSDNLQLMPLWDLLAMDYGTDHSKRVAQLRNYFQENANREYLELYEEFIYGIPGDYADNYDVIQEALVTDEELGAVDETPSDRIPIYTEAELNKIGKSDAYPLDGDYVLMRDIEMKNSYGGIGYTSDKTIQPFTGSFDGNGHTIYNMNLVPRYNGTSEVYMGFILYNQGEVYNLRFLDSNDDCRESQRTTTTIKTNAANATAYLGLVVGRNEAEPNTCNLYNIYVDNATFIVKNAPAKTAFGLVAGYSGEDVFTQDVTVVNSYVDIYGTADDGFYHVGGAFGGAFSGSGIISHDNVIKIDKNAEIGGCVGTLLCEESKDRVNTYAYDNEVQSANSSNLQLAGSNNLNAYSFGGADKFALTNEKLFKYYCDNDAILGGMGGYAEEWKENSETASKPWLIVHAPDGMTAYQNSLIGTKNLKVYFTKYGDDTNTYEDVTDRVNFVYDFSKIGNDVPVSVVYGKHLVEFTVDVVEPVVTDIAVINKGKTQFRVGEKFDNADFEGQILLSNSLTESLNPSDAGLKVYIPELEGDEPIEVGEYKFTETTNGTDVVVEYKGCTETYKISVLPEDLEGKLHFTSTSVESAPGGEFDVVITLNNNPGIIALSAYLEYDNDLFEVVDVIDGGLLSKADNLLTQTPEVKEDLATVPLIWMNASASAENNAASGTLVTVKFKAKKGDFDQSVYGMHTIKCVNGEAVNNKGELVEIPALTVKVRLNETTVGDVDSNSKINIWDAVLLTQHTFDTPRSTVNTAAADLNRDGKVNQHDSSYLNRHMVGFFGLTHAPGKYDVKVKNSLVGDKILEALTVNSPLPEPEVTLGYIFKGYYADQAYETEIDVVPEASVKEMVIYAKYDLGYAIESDLDLANDIHVYGHETVLSENADLYNVYDGDRLVYTGVNAIPASCKPTTGLRVEKYEEDLTGRTYSITYVNDVECTYTAENPTTYTYGVDTVLTSPVSVENTNTGRNAINFAGWYDNAEFEGLPVTNLNGRSGNITLYAKWDKWTCRVSLDPRGGTLAQSVLTHTYGTETVLPIPTHSNPAYKFVRWVWVGGSYYGTVYLESIPAVPHYLYDGFGYELYAEWSYEPTIKLTLTGNTTDPLSTDVEVRENIDAYTAKYSIAEPPATFVKANDGEMYKFMGWYATNTGAFVTEQYLKNVEIDLDLTAKWEWQDTSIYVNFLETDGTLIEKVKLNYSTSLNYVEAIATPVKAGYKLAGWTTTPFDDKAGYLPYYPFYVPLEGVHDGIKEFNLYAYWIPEEYAVEFTYDNDATLVDELYDRVTNRKRQDTIITITPRGQYGLLKTVPYAKLCVDVDVMQYERTFWFDNSRETAAIGFSMNQNQAPRGVTWLTDSKGINHMIGFEYLVTYSSGNQYINSNSLGGWDYTGRTKYYVYYQPDPPHHGYASNKAYIPGTGLTEENFATTYTKEGFEFAGWYDNPKFEGNPITSIPADYVGDIIVYAKWVENTTATE